MKLNHYESMRKTILSCMILVPFILFVLMLGIGYYYFTTSLEDSAVSGMKRIVKDHQHIIETFLAERKANLEFILHSHTFEHVSQTETLHKIFVNLQRNSNAFVDIGVFDEEGVHLAYQGPYELTGKVYKDADWFKEVVKKGYYVSDIFLGFRKAPHFVVAVARGDDEKKWVIRATIDTYIFNNLVREVRMGKTGEAYLLNTEGVFQTERRSGGSLMDKDPDHRKYPAFSLSIDAAEIETFIHTDITGNKYLYATTWLRDKKWLLVARQEKADAFKLLRAAAYLIVLISVIGGAYIVAMAFYLTEHIIRRMKQSDTEKDRLEEQLIRAHRLAELGEMAAGFAHEINNPLQIIKSEQSLIEILMEDMEKKGNLKESEDLTEVNDSMAQIKLQIGRCAEITQAILKFGRKGETKVQDVDLGLFIPEIVNMVAKKASVHGIDLVQHIADNMPNVNGDPGHIQQILLNLFNNAMDAIVEKHGTQGGKLVVETGAMNGNVEILIKDNGTGISAENQAKIFSPFFTTKPVGKGTGLGLSVCYGIIDNMGGTMEVNSQQGVGTTFMIRLPAA